MTHHVADNRVPWLVYVRAYYVSIATFYLGDAQITREVCRVCEGNEKEETVEILLFSPSLVPFVPFAEMPC